MSRREGLSLDSWKPPNPWCCKSEKGSCLLVQCFVSVIKLNQCYLPAGLLRIYLGPRDGDFLDRELSKKSSNQTLNEATDYS